MHTRGDDTETLVVKELSKQYQRIIDLLPASTHEKIRKTAQSVIAQSSSSDGYNTDIVSDSLKATFENLSALDFDVLVGLTTFELWQYEEKALGALLEEMHRMNESKERQRKRLESLDNKRMETESTPSGSSLRGPPVKRLKPNPRLGTKTNDTRNDYSEPQKPSSISRTPPPPPPSVPYLSIDELEEIKDNLNSLNEQSEILSLKLQMTMDRRSKYISTLSNMMKKISTTQDDIIQNIK
jgi:hypothetical protein